MRSEAAADRLLEESWEGRTRRLPRRELVTEIVFALLFVASAGALLLLPGATTGFDLTIAAVLVGLYAIVAGVEFPVGAGNVLPTQLVLFPMLMLAPPGAVPFLVAAGSCVLLAAPRLTSWYARRGEIARGRQRLRWR